MIDSRLNPVVEAPERVTFHTEKQFRAVVDRTRRELYEMGASPDKIRAEVKDLERSFAKHRAKWRAKESRNG